jgi:large subunit ribosomal protein L18e
MKFEKNNKLKELTAQLWASKAKVWKAVAKKLQGPTQNYSIVNVSKLDKCSKEGFILLVPGKVLGTGDLNQKIEVAAYKFSEGAKTKILAKGGKVHTLADVAKKNPEGKKVIIIG